MQRQISSMDYSATATGENSPLLSSAGLFERPHPISPIKTGVTIEDVLPETVSYISDPSTFTQAQHPQLLHLLQDAEHQFLVCFPIVYFKFIVLLHFLKNMVVINQCTLQIIKQICFFSGEIALP